MKRALITGIAGQDGKGTLGGRLMVAAT